MTMFAVGASFFDSSSSTYEYVSILKRYLAVKYVNCARPKQPDSFLGALNSEKSISRIVTDNEYRVYHVSPDTPICNGRGHIPLRNFRQKLLYTTSEMRKLVNSRVSIWPGIG